MERASKLIRGLRLPSDTMSAEELACSAWPEAVGRKIAAHTRAVRMVRTRLVVEVEDKTWQRQLFALTPFILFNLQKHLGSGVVDELDLRVVPRRREPQRAIRGFPRAPRSRRGRCHRRPGVARPLQSIAKKGAGVKITEPEVRYVAGLANLNLTDAEVAKFQADLDDILQHIDKLNEIDTGAVEPMAQVLFDAEETATLRADVPVPPLGNQAALASAPQPGAGYFKVPKVIER